MLHIKGFNDEACLPRNYHCDNENVNVSDQLAMADSTHLRMDKMSAISQTTFSNAFLMNEIFPILMQIFLNLSLRVR